MRGAVKKVIMGLFAVFMVCLIVSTATTTVTAAAYWGTLKTGDEMRWQSSQHGTVTIKIVEVNDELISVELNGNARDIDPNGFYGPAGLMPWIYPKEDQGGSIQNYEFEGTSYKTYYTKTDHGDGSYGEIWMDFDSGILFEWSYTEADGTKTVYEKLTYSTADMADASGGGGCLGTILIALVSVTAVVSYSVLWKKKKL